MPKNQLIKKVLIIGAGPNVIGQTSEFDCACLAACQAFHEEHVQTIAVDSNPATIFTDEATADRVYIEALNADVIQSIIEREKPDGLLAACGGKAAVSVAIELAARGVLEQQGVQWLGGNMDSLIHADDKSWLSRICRRTGLRLFDEDANGANAAGGAVRVIGWEIMRDASGRSIAVCSSENIGSIGVHTGDSAVVIPCQTLDEDQKRALKEDAFRLADALGIVGSCHMQFALLQDGSHCVLEVQSGHSRASELAAKATGYPVSRVAAKLSLGYTLGEIHLAAGLNASFEPDLNHIAVKLPRWPFDRFSGANRILGRKMKSAGEAMAIGSNFEQALLKAVRSLDIGMCALTSPAMLRLTDEQLWIEIKAGTDERLSLVAEAIRRKFMIDDIVNTIGIHDYFLKKMRHICEIENIFIQNGRDSLTETNLLNAKIYGIADKRIAVLTGTQEEYVRTARLEMGVVPVFLPVCEPLTGVCSTSPLYYSVYDRKDTFLRPLGRCTVVLGSGPVRIGQGVEYDYCSAHAAVALKKCARQVALIHNNPDAASIAVGWAERVYIEPLTPEDMFAVLNFEQPACVMAQFGGLAALKLAHAAERFGFDLAGTPSSAIDVSQSRAKFGEALGQMNIARPVSMPVFLLEEAIRVSNQIGYPVVARFENELGMQKTVILNDDDDIMGIGGVFDGQQVVMEKYHRGREMEVDAVCDGNDIIFPGIMENIERAGVHSGDSISVFPARNISVNVKASIYDATKQIALRLGTRGPINIQYIVDGEDVLVLEANQMASSNLPSIAKASGIPLIELAMQAALGESVSGMGVRLGDDNGVVAARVPVFSLDRLAGAEISLGPEMKSTGAVLGLSRGASEAIFKGLIAADMVPQPTGAVLISMADRDKHAVIDLSVDLSVMGYDIYATVGTASVLNRNFVGASVVTKEDDFDEAAELIASGRTALIINTPTRGQESASFGFKLRRMAVESGVVCLTSVDTAQALVAGLKGMRQKRSISLLCLQDIRSESEYSLEVVSNQPCAKDTYKIMLRAPTALIDAIMPGQFAHIKAPGRGDLLLRRPISIHDCDRQSGTVTMIYATKGAGTQAMAATKPGQAVDILAPLGRPFPELGGRVWLLGGGIGIAPLLGVARTRTDCTAFLGWVDKQHVYSISEFEKNCAEVNIYTDDGSLGRKGYANTGMIERLRFERPDVIFACGPMAMIRALKKEQIDVPCYVSLEERMGCGFGACMTCACKIRVKDGFEYKRVCADGPVFRLEDVIFD